MGENDLADLMGGFTLSLASARMRRSLWAFSGWPARMVGVLGSDGVRDSTIAAFKADYTAFQALASHPQKTQAMQSLLARSVFNDVSVKQFVEAVLVKMVGCCKVVKQEC
jgi:hypothetical protein